MTIDDRLTDLETSISRVERMLCTLVGETKPQIDPRRFMSVAEASAAVGLSKQTLWCYCNRGDIRYSKIGRSVIIHTDSLYKYIEQFARKTIAERAQQTLKNLTK